jgi:hypothetical protein
MESVESHAFRAAPRRKACGISVLRHCVLPAIKVFLAKLYFLFFAELFVFFHTMPPVKGIVIHV